MHKKVVVSPFLNCKVVYEPLNFKCQGSLENYVIIEHSSSTILEIETLKILCVADIDKHAKSHFCIFLSANSNFIFVTGFCRLTHT